MDEQRVQAYAQLIDRLLSCPNGQESEILQQNSELVDEGFFQIANQYAQHLRENDKEQAATFLVNLIQQLSQNANLLARQDKEQAYLQLIKRLLRCNSGEEEGILQANPELIDFGLIETMEKVAEQFEKEGNSNSKWLRNIAQNLTQYLSSYMPTQADFNFLLEIMETIGGGATQAEIHFLFQQNLDKISLTLGQALQIWANDTVKTLEPESQQLIGCYISEFTNSIKRFSLGNRTINLEISIIGYSVLSTIFTEADFPEQWAATQNNLGFVYSQRIVGNKRENIEQAINAYTAALRFYTEADFPQDWAGIQYNLGLAYSRRIAGNRKENIEQSITAHTAALRFYTEVDFPQDWAATQNNLGIAYGQRIAGDKRENIEQSITAYTAALRFYNVADLADLPQRRARTQHNLGHAYRNRIAGDKRENIEQAISLYTEALRVRTEANFPQDWAATQNNLGIAYNDRIAGDKRENIEQAISLYTEALRFYTEADFPQDWAATQHNLGIAYRNRTAGDRQENIEQAISAHTAALRVRTEADFPQDWAITQDSLGSAYLERIAGDMKENIERAINIYTAALRVRTEVDFPQDWAGTQNNLGIAYSHRAVGEKKGNIEQAINAYTAVLSFYTKDSSPQDWATTQHNLGAAYNDRIAGNKKENIEQAISAYTAALQVRTKDDFPQDWATTQNALGTAYNDRIAGDREENIEQAIKCYQAAMKVYTPQSNPIECLRTSRNLGDLQFNQGSWQLAIETYSLSIQGVEQICVWAISEDHKQKIIFGAISVYQNIVQACINLGQINKAIEYVERGKARNLVDLLTTKDLYPKGDIPEEIIVRLRTLRQKVLDEAKRLSQQRSLGNSLSHFDGGTSRSFTDSVSRNQILDSTRLNRIRQELDSLVAEHIQPIDPSFELTQNKLFNFEQIQATLPTQKTVLIEWFIGDGTLSAFIITPQRSMPVHFSYTKEQLNVLINTVARYFDTYVKRDRSWQTILPDLLTQLAENLQIEAIVEQIKLLIPNCDRLILVPHRWLHLLPIHALPLADGKCLLDLFSQGVSYAPSVQLLQITQTQNKPQLTNFFAVQNPTEDLDFTNVEVQAVRSQFRPNDDVLEKEQATKLALTKERLGQANLTHFSCHGKFNFENPELSALLLANSKVGKSVEKEDKEKGETRYLPSRDGGSIDLEQCLTLGEIFSYDLTNCRLVTLSACETGLTDFKSLSDEYIGLPSGFLYAGSPSVVSSLWAVSDMSTSFLMIKFYQNLQEIDSVAIALNQAQLWLRSVIKEELIEWKATLNVGSRMWKIDAALINLPDNSRPFASPYYWAAFCAVGS